MRNSYRYALGVLLLTAVWTHSALATVHTVLPDGSGDFPTIQAAINAASHGDIIQLGDGTFTGPGNRDIDYLGKAITIRSISGDPEACVLYSGDTYPYSRVFILQSGEGPCSVLEGVTVTGGSPGLSGGGGMRCLGSSPTVRNVSFSDCSGCPGGGMYCEDASPVLENVVFDDNFALSGHGGGMYCSGGSPILTDVVFTRNTAEYILGFTTCGGGLYCEGSTPTLTNVEFLSNYCSNAGGGMYCSGSATLNNVVFANNHLELWHAAGAYGLDLSSGTVTDAVFRGHSGPAFCGRGHTSLTRVTFSGNAMGIHLFPSTTILTNVTFADNGSAMGTYLYEPARDNQVIEASNTIIAFSGGPSIDLYPGVNLDITLTCCDVYGNAGGDWVECIADQYGINGNISENPCFCRHANPDQPYALCVNSPCAAENSPECGQIGAWPAACDDYDPCPVEDASWGSIKAMYR